MGGPLTIGVSLGAALLLSSKLVRFKGLFRTIYFTPFVTTLVAVAIVWRYLYHTRYGFFNFALSQVGIQPIDWLGDPRWAMPAIILMAVWKSFGYNMLIFIAGLEEGRFLILPHPTVTEYVRRKAEDHDRWIRGMRRLQERFGAMGGMPDAGTPRGGSRS